MSPYGDMNMDRSQCCSLTLPQRGWGYTGTMPPRVFVIVVICCSTASAQQVRIYEAERHVKRDPAAGAQTMSHYGRDWSGDAHLLWKGKLSEETWIEFRVAESGRYDLALQFTLAPDYGAFQLLLDGKQLAKRVDTYSPNVELAPITKLGEVHLSEGIHRLTFKLIGHNEKAKLFRGDRYLLGLDYLRLEQKFGFGRSQLLLAKYCFRCHDDEKTEGKPDLESLRSKDHFLANIETTAKVATALESGAMPPEDEPQPSGEVRGQLVEQFKSYIDEYAQTATEVEPVVMRRLNRYEYNNAVRDLLYLKGDIYPLPEKTIRADQPYFQPASGQFPDAVQVGNRTLGKFQIERQILTGVVPFAIDLQSEHGFNNRGDELSISPILLESFLKLGQSIVNSPEFEGYCTKYDQLFKGEPVDARKRLGVLLERAFRAPAEPTTLDRYLAFFEREIREGKSFEQSMKSVVSAVLASPRFLFIAELAKGGPEPVENSPTESQRLSDYELATRLSFFLWSSIPDEELLAHARARDLHDPEVLESQVRRMLRDSRCQALSQNFARQWLRLDQLITAVPDERRFRIYYSRIGCEQWKFGLQAMLEPLLLFESILVEDRSIMLLVDSDYSYRSDELQSWYQADIPFNNKGNVNRFNTFQQSFRKRKLKSRREGGVITTAATLTMTSAPLRSSPIVRGAWVATVIFNAPPEPPPDVVPEIEADDAAIEAKGLTLRERLKQHQINESCAACHAKIDPLGFALENYDAVGRWRDEYRSGLEIDASGKLFGELDFNDIESFKDAILANPERFTRAFTEHLLSYALSRQLKVTDKPAIDRIVDRVAADEGKMSRVILEIIKSHPFQHKAGLPQ